MATRNVLGGFRRLHVLATFIPFTQIKRNQGKPVHDGGSCRQSFLVNQKEINGGQQSSGMRWSHVNPSDLSDRRLGGLHGSCGTADQPKLLRGGQWNKVELSALIICFIGGFRRFYFLDAVSKLGASPPLFTSENSPSTLRYIKEKNREQRIYAGLMVFLISYLILLISYLILLNIIFDITEYHKMILQQKQGVDFNIIL